MRARRHAVSLAALLSLAALYGAYPYATLYRLRGAARRGNAGELATLVDWGQVREGIKEDICDTVFDPPAVAAPTRAATVRPASLLAPPANAEPSHADPKQLPPFGFSFARGIAGNAVDALVTPATLVRADHEAGANRGGRVAGESPLRVTWAFFTSPTSFTVDLMPRRGRWPAPVELRMELRGGHWMVTRATLPPALLRALSG